jgi:hypothetical protein
LSPSLNWRVTFRLVLQKLSPNDDVHPPRQGIESSRSCVSLSRLGIERTAFEVVRVAWVGIFNLPKGLLAGAVLLGSRFHPEAITRLMPPKGAG